tara:strand:- start:616 stop:723 length:108 start_codon:yes stop_codon:yes gene_type:complete
MDKEQILNDFLDWLGEQDDELYFELTEYIEKYIDL